MRYNGDGTGRLGEPVCIARSLLCVICPEVKWTEKEKEREGAKRKQGYEASGEVESPSYPAPGRVLI